MTEKYDSYVIVIQGKGYAAIPCGFSSTLHSATKFDSREAARPYLNEYFDTGHPCEIRPLKISYRL